MGADGGIYIYKYKDVQANWKEIQTKLFNLFSTKDKTVKNWRTDEEETVTPYLYNIDLAKQVSQYSIEDKTCEEFCRWLHTLCSNCDTPYSLGDFILMSYGDNVWGDFSDFTDCFYVAHFDSVETWT